MSLMYVRNPQTLDVAISIARNVEGGLVIANESKQVYAFEDQIIQLSKQINALARGEPSKNLTFNLPGESDAKKRPFCFNYQNERYMARECN